MNHVPFEIAVNNGEIHLKLTGPLVMGPVSANLRAVLQKLITGIDSTLVIDLEDARTIDAGGMAVLLEAHEIGEWAGVDVELSNLSPEVDLLVQTKLLVTLNVRTPERKLTLAHSSHSPKPPGDCPRSLRKAA